MISKYNVRATSDLNDLFNSTNESSEQFSPGNYYTCIINYRYVVLPRETFDEILIQQVRYKVGVGGTFDHSPLISGRLTILNEYLLMRSVSLKCLCFLVVVAAAVIVFIICLLYCFFYFEIFRWKYDIISKPRSCFKFQVRYHIPGKVYWTNKYYDFKDTEISSFFFFWRQFENYSEYSFYSKVKLIL